MSNKMLIIGARGMVGQQAVQYFSKEFDVIALSKMDLSVTDMSEIKRIFDRLKPYIVLNCSVIRNDRCLIDTQLAREVNAEGVRNLAIQCQKSNAVLVQLWEIWRQFCTQNTTPNSVKAGNPYYRRSIWQPD